MSDDQGTPIPDALFDDTDQATLRQRREREACEAIEAAVRAGEMTPREADTALLELALSEFDFLGDSVVDALRRRGHALLDEAPGLVESRRVIARRHGVPTGDGTEGSGGDKGSNTGDRS